MRLWLPLPSAAGNARRQAIVLTNHAGRLLTIRGVTVSGELGVATPGLPLRLPSGAIFLLPVWRRSAWRAGSGTVTILSDARENPQSVAVASAGPGLLLDGLLRPVSVDLLFAAALCLAYWLAMVAVRWQRVAMETRGDLRGEIRAVRAELAVMAPAGGGDRVAAEGLLGEAGDLLDGPKDKSGSRALNMLFWSRGQEINGWGYVHEAQIRMVPLMDPAIVEAQARDRRDEAAPRKRCLLDGAGRLDPYGAGTPAATPPG